MKIFYSIQCFLLFASLSSTIAQNSVQNRSKYDYYRSRFVSNYVSVGINQGESLVAESRCRNGNKLSGFGDQTIYLAQYWAMLATEYKRLESIGETTTNTLTELFYAMEAFNRLDKTAESYYRGGNPTAAYNGSQYYWIADKGPTYASDLNGFFIREDVPYDFLIQGNGHNSLIDENTEYSCLILHEVDNDFTKQGHQPCPEFSNYGFYTGEMSKDQVYWLLWGLKHITKFIPSGINSNQVFSDNNYDIKQEAINITNRIVGFLKENEYLIKNPVTGQFVKTPNDAHINQPNVTYAETVGSGANAQDFMYGIACTASSITGEPILNYLPTFPLVAVSYPELYVATIAALLLEWEALPLFALTSGMGDETGKICVLAAAGNSWHSNLGINNTRSLLKELTGCTPIQSEILYLSHCVLFDKAADLAYSDDYCEEVDFKELLDEVPCSGIYNYGIPNKQQCVQFQSNYQVVNGQLHNYASENWSSPSRWLSYHPINRGIFFGLGTNTPGDYNGLDFLLLYNLVCIADPSYANNDIMGSDILLNNSIQFPYIAFNPVTGWINIGSIMNSVSYRTTLNIEASCILKSSSNIPQSALELATTAEISFKAGNSIHLKSGFRVENGAKFHAYIGNITCINGEYRAPSILNNNSQNNTLSLTNLNIGQNKNENSDLSKVEKVQLDNFSLNSIETIQSVHIYNSLGKEVFKVENVKNNTYDYSNLNLASGFYLFSIVVQSKEIINKKIIINQN